MDYVGAGIESIPIPFHAICDTAKSVDWTVLGTSSKEKTMTATVMMVLVALSQLGSPQADTLSKTKLTDLAASALQRVERMRNQRLTKPLKMGVKTREEILSFIQRRLAEEYGPEKVQAEGWLLEDQGLLPRNTDYVDLISKLLMEQVAGFYDHTRQELYIASWLDTFVQGPVMAHEIFHAIQDQEWGAGKLLDSKVYSHDQILAHAALLEGDATIVMLNYVQPETGGIDTATSKLMLNMVAASLPMQMSSPQFPTMAGAPEYVKQSLIFPYQKGLLFVGALRQNGYSKARLRDVYRDPPESTEQILHPEKYYKDRDRPSLVTFPDPLLKGFRVRWDGTTGEFHARQMLSSTVTQPSADVAASGWDGDHTQVLTKGTDRVCITHSVWDSHTDAQEFEAALKSRPNPEGIHLVSHVSDRAVTYAFSASKRLAEQAVRVALSKAKVTIR